MATRSPARKTAQTARTAKTAHTARIAETAEAAAKAVEPTVEPTVEPAPKPAAAKKPATRAPRRRRPSLRGVQAVRDALRANETPIFFVGATPYNLLGLDRWVGGLGYISFLDPFDGAHPLVFAPSDRPDTAFTTGAQLTNHLLRHPEVQARLAQSEQSPKITAVYTDAETEELCAALGYELIVPSAADRDRLASLITPPEPSDAAGRMITVAVVVTRGGTVVGPYLTSLVGHPDLTPDPYRWCGNETFPTVLTAERRGEVANLARELGDRLATEGFRGYAEIQVRIDSATGASTVVALTPGIGAAAALSTTSAGAYADLPPYALHLAERLDLDYELDVAEINRRWEDLLVADAHSQLVISAVEPATDVIIETPVSGRYVLDELGEAQLLTADLDGHGLVDESEFFFLRIAGTGELRWPGTDLGIVITRGRLQVGSADGPADPDGVAFPPFLTARAQTMIAAVRRRYVTAPAYVTDPAW